MISASTSRINSTNTRNNLTYIDSLIKAATDQGLYVVVIEGTYMDEDMVNNLRTNYGYNINKKAGLLGDNGDFVSYIVSW